MTLYEVVVSVGTITALLAMLIPALSDTRRQGKLVHCLSNLGRIAEAGAIYPNADRNDNAIPVHQSFAESVPYLEAYAFGGKSGIGEPLAGENPVNSRWGTLEGLGPAARPLNSLIYGDVFPDHQVNPGAFGLNWMDDTTLDLPIYRCPADHGYAGIHHTAFKNSRLTSFDHYGTSYSANSFWIGTGVGTPFCIMRSNSPYLHRFGAIMAPSRTILYEENCGRFAWMHEPDPCPFLDGISGQVRGWHGSMWRFNVAFVDGHAGSRNINGYTAYDLGRFPPGASWPTYQCVIVRGAGWQKDTLPLPDVGTDLPCPPSGRPSQEGNALE